MVKKILFYILIFILMFNVASAVCVLNFDKEAYLRGETVTASMSCTVGTEANQPYTVVWRTQDGTNVENDTGVTPAVPNTLFAETYNIPLGSGITNINATLVGNDTWGTSKIIIEVFFPFKI